MEKLWNWPALRQRADEAEIMDGPDYGPKQVVDTFRFIVPVNRLFGGVKPTLDFFRRESRTWEPGATQHVLDVGCGIGDVPAALIRWARRAGHRLQVDAIDRDTHTIALAQKRYRAYPEIHFTCRDLAGLAGCNYDYVHAAQFLHHFPNGQVGEVLWKLLSLCRRVLVVNDLIRARLHYLATWLVTLPPAPAVSRNDARLSVRKGFTLEELRGILNGSGIRHFSLKRRFFYRFLLQIRATTNDGAQGP